MEYRIGDMFIDRSTSQAYRLISVQREYVVLAAGSYITPCSMYDLRRCYHSSSRGQTNTVIKKRKTAKYLRMELI